MRREDNKMKRLPDSELEIMMIIWDYGHAVGRTQIEERMKTNRQLSPTTILSFLSRLEEKGFLSVTKEGKNNLYTVEITKEDYLKQESRSLLKRMYQNSIKNFLTAFYDGEDFSEENLQELQDFLDKKKKSKVTR